MFSVRSLFFSLRLWGHTNWGVILLIFLGAACNSSHNSQQLEYWIPEEDRVITIPVDSTTGYFWRYLDYYHNVSGDKLIFQDFSKGSISTFHFFDINTGTIEKIMFPKDGPDGLGYPSGFYLMNMDSIYVPIPYEYSLAVVNRFGKKISKISTSAQGLEVGISSLMYPRIFNKIDFINGRLFIPSIPDFDSSLGRYKVIHGFVTIVDVGKGSFKSVVGFSHYYKEGSYWASQQVFAGIACNRNRNLFIVNYPVDPFLYQYDMEGNLIDSVQVNSHLISSAIQPSEFPLDNILDDLKFNYQSHTYFAIAYDPYRNIYYRFIKERYDDASIQLMINQKVGKPGRRSVLIIDANFDLVKELLLDENKYTVDEFFISPNGLYILNKNDNEEVKTYSLFRLD